MSNNKNNNPTTLFFKGMKIEFIYTFNNPYTGKNRQKTELYPCVLPILQSKEVLLEFATAMLKGNEKEYLCKISCCVYLNTHNEEKDIVLPDWLTECNGKLWF